MTGHSDNPILLGEADVRRALPMADAIDAMRQAFVSLSGGRSTVPGREGIKMDEFAGSVLFMPAYDPDLSAFAIKIASIHDGNRAKGLESVQAVVALFDAATGRMEAMLEGRTVTAIRTGAGSGLATDLLASPDARVVAILGSGVQARSHLESVCAVREIDRAMVIARSQERARVFADEMAALLDVEVKVDDGTGLRDAGVICTTTAAVEPLVALADVAPGVHINAVGTHRPTDTEIGLNLVAASKLVVDQKEACMKEAGEIALAIRAGLIDEGHIFAEVGEIEAGLKPGRESVEEITMFKSVGNAIQDLFAAATAVKNARRLGIGRPLNL